MIRLLRGLFARVPVLAGDLTVSIFDIKDRRDGWGWGGNVEDVGLFPGAKKRLWDLGYSDRDIRGFDADVRAANGGLR